METRRRRRRRPGDGARPTGQGTSPLHPRSGRTSVDSIGTSGTTAAVANAPHQPASSSTLNGKFRGMIFWGANSHAHFQQQLGNQPPPDRVRGNVMDQEMHTDAISAVDSTVPGSYFAGASGENRHMMQAQHHAQHERDEETVEFHQPKKSRRPLWPDVDTNTPTTMTKQSNSNEEGPVYTGSGLQLTHRPSPLRGTGAASIGRRGNGKNFELKSNDHVDDSNNNSSTSDRSRSPCICKRSIVRRLVRV